MIREQFLFSGDVRNKCLFMGIEGKYEIFGHALVIFGIL